MHASAAGRTGALSLLKARRSPRSPAQEVQMTRHFLVAALAAVPLAACASNQAPATDPGQTAYDPSQVPIYYVGQKPQCGMTRLSEVQGYSEYALRAAAVQLRGNAVVGVSSRMVAVEQPRGIYRRAITGPAAVRVFQGMAVRLVQPCAV
jgi:hypothetical protein